MIGKEIVLKQNYTLDKNEDKYDSLYIGVKGDVNKVKKLVESKNEFYSSDTIIYADEEKIISYANNKKEPFEIIYDVGDYIIDKNNDDISIIEDFINGALGSSCDYDIFKINTGIKEVLMVSYLNRPPNKRDKLFIVHKIDKKNIMNSIVAIYPFGNVYSNGYLCWGEEASNDSRSIRDWFNMKHNEDIAYFLQKDGFEIMYDDMYDRFYCWQDTAEYLAKRVNAFVERGKDSGLLVSGRLGDFLKE